MALRDVMLRSTNAKADARKKTMAAEAEAAAKQAAADKTAAEQKQLGDYFGSWDWSKLGQGLDNIGKEQRASAENEARVNATNARFGTDLSWLDPSFQYNPTLLGQSAGSMASADPSAVGAQNAAMSRAQQLANDSLSFQSPDQQNALMQQWAQIQGGQGAPSFMGNGTQEGLLGQLGSIIGGGGASSIEMADRQRGRADSEAWLRGQREADMQEYAERGLTGSGMELLSLAADRQAAAGRNSLADLETSKALEERRLSAIDKAGGIANQMRGQDYNERSYLDERGINALTSRTDLANEMRKQQESEQVSNRNAQQAALGTFANTATSARNASAQESQYRAGAADDFATLNQSAINNAASSNAQFRQNAYTNMMQQRQSLYENDVDRKARIAQGLMNEDQQENVTGFNQGTNVGNQTANQYNNGQANYNGTITGAAQNANANTSAAQQAYNAIYPQMGQVGAEWINTVVGGAINQGANAPSGGGMSQPGTTWAGSAGAAAPKGPTQTKPWDPADESTWKY